MKVDSGTQGARPGGVIARGRPDDDPPEVELTLLEDVAVLEGLTDGISEVVVAGLTHLLPDRLDVAPQARVRGLELKTRALATWACTAVARVVAVTSEDAQDGLERLVGNLACIRRGQGRRERIDLPLPRVDRGEREI